MRKLDWALAAVIAAFLLGALAIEAGGLLVGRVGVADRPDAFAPSEVSLHRLVSRLPGPILPGEAP
jgi:hypothetical protein